MNETAEDAIYYSGIAYASQFDNAEGESYQAATIMSVLGCVLQYERKGL